MISFEVYNFLELNTVQLYQLLKLRAEVFVVEQKCAFQDLDGVDYECIHILGYDDGELFGYSRIVAPEALYKEASIGRVVVSQKHRANGYGKELFKYANELCLTRHAGHSIKLMAQLYLKAFYESFGYKQISEPFLEDDILHIYMVK
jgi:ElaA protein